MLSTAEVLWQMPIRSSAHHLRRHKHRIAGFGSPVSDRQFNLISNRPSASAHEVNADGDHKE